MTSKLSPVLLYGPAQKEITSWPLSAKKDLGSVLTLLQKGDSVGLPDVRPMPSDGRGVAEIRISDSSGIYRVFFITWTKHGILVFHGFKKKTQTTPKSEIETAKTRLNAFLEELDS